MATRKLRRTQRRKRRTLRGGIWPFNNDNAKLKKDAKEALGGPIVWSTDMSDVLPPKEEGTEGFFVQPGPDSAKRKKEEAARQEAEAARQEAEAARQEERSVFNTERTNLKKTIEEQTNKNSKAESLLGEYMKTLLNEKAFRVLGEMPKNKALTQKNLDENKGIIKTETIAMGGKRTRRRRRRHRKSKRR